jgi:hypothetical protein
MPAKQTREAIEAELNASERERIALQLQEVAGDIDIVEKELRALETHAAYRILIGRNHCPSEWLQEA